MLAVGMKDRAIAPETQIADFRAIWSEGPVVKLPNAGHCSQEGAPSTVIALIELFVKGTE
jgi:cis-3-alkyl-4-acyloxetan-2-one decarboxylase